MENSHFTETWQLKAGTSISVSQAFTYHCMQLDQVFISLKSKHLKKSCL